MPPSFSFWRSYSRAVTLVVSALVLAIAACRDAPTSPVPPKPSLVISDGWPEDVWVGCDVNFRSAGDWLERSCGFRATFETPTYVDSLIYNDWYMSPAPTHPRGYYYNYTEGRIDLNAPVPTGPLKLTFSRAVAGVIVRAAPLCYDFSCMWTDIRDAEGKLPHGSWSLIAHEVGGGERRVEVTWECTGPYYGAYRCNSGYNLQSDIGLVGIEIIPTGNVLRDHLGFEVVAGGTRLAAESIVLSCPDAVTRGAEARCTVAPSSAGTDLTVLEWHFQPDDPSLGTDITPPEGAALTTEWKGTMAASGTVRVKARVGGKEPESTAHISVNPRNWSSKPVEWTWDDISPSNLPERPTQFEKQLGNTEFTSEVYIDAITYISGGPNYGLMFYSGPPGKVIAKGAANTRAIKKGSAFYQAQPPMRNSNVIGGVKQCTRADVDRLAKLVWLHEGTRAREKNSHVDTFLREYERLSRLHGEALVGRFDFNLQKVLDAWLDTAGTYSRATTDSKDHNPLTGKLDCEFNYTYGPGAK